MIRKGMVSRDMAIYALWSAREREIQLEGLPINGGFQRIPMKPTPKLGELLSLAYIVSEHHLNESLHRTLIARKFLGEVLVEQRHVPQVIIDAAIEMQEMMDNGTLSAPLATEALMLMRANATSLTVAVAEVGAYKPRANKAVVLMELLSSSGAITLTTVPQEVQECTHVNYNQARQAVRLLQELELVPEQTLFNALRCVYLLDEKFLDFQKAIMAIDHASRRNISIDNALVELAWTVRTRLRSAPALKPA